MASDPAPAPGTHQMACQAETPGEALFVCVEESCGRRVVVGKSRPGLTVVDRGAFSVRHTGSLGGVAIGEVALA